MSSWNCGRALTQKIEDIKLFVENQRPHLLAVLEADLHGPNTLKRSTFTTEEIFELFKIEGYRIILPDTWYHYSQARIIVYANNDINVAQRENPGSIINLPNITLEVGKVRERKSLDLWYSWGQLF